MAKTEVNNPIFFLMFAIIGIFLIGLSILFFTQSIELVTKGISGQGLITEINRFGSKNTYNAQIEFITIDGKKNSFIYPFSNRYSLSVGEIVPIIYTPDNPSHVTKDSFNGLWMKPLIPFIVGFAFTLTGFFSFLYIRNKQKLKKALALNNRKVTAKVNSIDGVASSNYKCTITAEYNENGQRYVYESDIIDLAAEDLKELKTVEVMVDPNNLKRYLIDTDKISLENSKKV